MLRKLSDVMKTNPGYRCGWRGDLPDTPLVNPRFGRIEHVVVCDDQGHPKYDQPIWIERVGAICVPVDSDGRLYFVKQYREALSTPGEAFEFASHDIESLGRETWELPRGFGEPGESPEQTALRETKEETGQHPTNATCIGYVNSNTTHCPNSNAVFVVQLAAQPKPKSKSKSKSKDFQHKSPEATESITRVKSLSLDETLAWVSDRKIFCNMTQSAVLAYLAWKAKDEQLIVGKRSKSRRRA